VSYKRKPALRLFALVYRANNAFLFGASGFKKKRIS
jgi:hypothetical protein